MTYEGTVQQGVVVFDSGAVPPEGIRVRVEALPSEARPTLAERFRSVIGVVSDLPEDFAEQHDHYIHGTPKR